MFKTFEDWVGVVNDFRTGRVAVSEGVIFVGGCRGHVSTPLHAMNLWFYYVGFSKMDTDSIFCLHRGCEYFRMIGPNLLVRTKIKRDN